MQAGPDKSAREHWSNLQQGRPTSMPPSRIACHASLPPPRLHRRQRVADEGAGRPAGRAAGAPVHNVPRGERGGRGRLFVPSLVLPQRLLHLVTAVLPLRLPRRRCRVRPARRAHRRRPANAPLPPTPPSGRAPHQGRTRPRRGPVAAARCGRRGYRSAAPCASAAPARRATTSARAASRNERGAPASDAPRPSTQACVGLGPARRRFLTAPGGSRVHACTLCHNPSSALYQSSARAKTRGGRGARNILIKGIAGAPLLLPAEQQPSRPFKLQT